MMLPIQYSTTCLTLLAVCFVLLGVGCGDSEDDEVLPRPPAPEAGD